MKLYSAMLGISLGLFFSASAMHRGGKVTKSIDEDTSYVYEILTQENTEDGTYLCVTKRINQETKFAAYSGVEVYDKIEKDESEGEPIMKQKCLGDFNEMTDENHKKLESLWDDLNSQVE